MSFPWYVQHGHLLPSGWHRAFLHHFFGLAKGIYTSRPGPTANAYTVLTFLGISFVSTSNPQDHAERSWDWEQNFRIPGHDRSWSDPVTADLADDESDQEGLKSQSKALVKQQVQSTASSLDHILESSSSSRAGRRRRRSHGVGIQPDEIVEPSNDTSESQQSARTEIRVERYPEHQDERSRAKRRIRSPTPPLPTAGMGGMSGRRQRHYVMEARKMYEPSDASIFSQDDSAFPGFTPLRVERTRPIPETPQRRRTFNSSSASNASAANLDKLPRAPSPPVPYIDTTPPSPSPRKIRRTTTEPITPTPSSRVRTLSPLSDFRGFRDPSPPSLPLGSTSTSNTSRTNYTSNTSYFQTPEPPPHLSWSAGYPTPPSLPPPPLSPTHSTFSNFPFETPTTPHHSHAYLNNFPPTPTSPTLENIAENIHGVFTISKILSVSDTPTGRFYKVQWADTWESKSSVRQSIESGKYRAQETLEWKYVGGQRLYHIRWKDTWESEDEIGTNNEVVREFWEEMKDGSRERVYKRSVT